MTTYWFRPKRYGYGATPSTWQGWAFTAAVVIVMLAASWLLNVLGHGNPWTWLAVVAIDVAALVVLWIVCRRKTDGEWRWRWGD